MGLRVQATKNVGAVWLGLLVQVAVGFFLSPFILHKLGDNAFSLWVLVFSLTGYYGVLDLGIRSSIVRYVARFAATRDEDNLAKFLSTSVAFYAFVSLLVLFLTGLGFFCLPSIFKIPPDLLESSRVLFVLAGVSAALSFPLGVFASVLEGLQKFSWLHISQIGVTLLRGLLIAIALTRGGGLMAIGVITTAMTLVSYLIIMWLAYRAFPLRFSSKAVDSKSFRQMLSYSAFVFMILVADKLRFQTGPILVGAMISSSAVAYFAIGSKLVEYSTSAVRSMAIVFTPMSSHLDATGDVVRLRQTLVLGSRACALVTFPLCAVIVILGRSIIEVWVGAHYLSSFLVLVILSVPRTLYLAHGQAPNAGNGAFTRRRNQYTPEHPVIASFRNCRGGTGHGNSVDGDQRVFSPATRLPRAGHFFAHFSHPGLLSAFNFMRAARRRALVHEEGVSRPSL
jgi:O-antigen/teichoic acid export membrane protein